MILNILNSKTLSPMGFETIRIGDMKYLSTTRNEYLNFILQKGTQGFSFLIALDIYLHLRLRLQETH